MFLDVNLSDLRILSKIFYVFENALALYLSYANFNIQIFFNNSKF